MRKRTSLHGGWTVRPVEPGPAVPAEIARSEVPAQVPGCVHTDLLRAGLIADPYVDVNEHELNWIGHTEWRYSSAFTWDGVPGTGAAGEAENAHLCCDGLDTVAEVALNGARLGATRNMHRSYRFDVSDLLQHGENELVVTFRSAYTEADKLREELGHLPNEYDPEPANFIRKMACNFGWDWGPTLVTAGIWRPIALETWDVGRLARVRPLVTVDPGARGPRVGRVAVHVDVQRSGSGTDRPLLVTARVGGVNATGRLAPGETSTVVEPVLPDPALWWPRGYGEQPLYELEVSLVAEDDGHRLDEWSRRVGFRSVELDTAPDEVGSRFAILVNGERVLVKGANWIPDDSFPASVDRERYAARIEDACAANMNLLRVWGGGLYESEDFYELCDERGVLVWQDFLFACAAYPEEPPIATEVEAEAREAVSRLSPHPSLVLWNGSNENIEGYFEWGWEPRVRDRTWGRGYYLDMLPRIVAEEDPTRPYWPSSPYSGSLDLHPQDERHGTSHTWDVWNDRDYSAYREHVPRFAAEFGFQGPPTYSTLRRALTDEPLRPDSPGLRHHQKADRGMGKLHRGLVYHFPLPSNFDDWHFLTQVNQARALTLGIEHLRSHWPRCTGTVIWQLNDCWPVISWAAIDGYGRRKPLWYALRRAYADRLVTVQPADERAGEDPTAGLVVALANDSAEPWSGEVVVSRRDLEGRVLDDAKLPFHATARSVTRAPVPPEVAAAARAGEELLVAAVDGMRAIWFFAEDRDIAYPPPRFDTEVRACGEGYEIEVTAHTLVRDLCLFADRLDPDAAVDDALATLLPGESAVFRVTTARGLDPDALARPPVLRCVNAAVLAARQGPDSG